MRMARIARYSDSLRAGRSGDRIPVGGEIFRTRPDRPWGPTSLLYNEYQVSFPEVKWLGRGVDHPSPFNAEVKERVELYLYSPSGPSWPVLGWTLTLPLPFTSMRMMFQTKVVEKIKTHILCSITFFFNLTFCEIMWKNMIKPDRPHR
jgi:hypothetical protein